MKQKAMTPAVAYLRASTYLQSCSIEVQLARISDYAKQNGYAVLRYYSDEGRSGLTMKRRSALKSLLEMVSSGTADFSTILVHDVSRWGRFQDVDEGAYYEHACKRAGIGVHYCAESFKNDGSTTTSLIKSIKRVIASEFSRELSTRVSAAQVRLAKIGFYQGGTPGYGLRRVAIDSRGRVVEEFSAGDHKGIAYRTTLVWGPKAEIETIQKIYTLYVAREMPIAKIARVLNEEGVRRDAARRRWTHFTVRQVLTSERYIGNYQYNRRNEKLDRKPVRNARSEWVHTTDVMPTVVSLDLFEKAQQRLKSATRYLSDEVLLTKLKRLLAQRARLSQALINSEPGTPAVATYSKRFGSLTEAYRRIGYTQLDQRANRINKAREKRISKQG